jgi:hypothetical protein
VTHAGLHAIHWASRHLPYRKAKLRTGVVFENLALAVAYEEARDRLAGDSVYRSVRHDWEARLRHMRYEVFGGRRSFYNWYLVEAVTVAALVRSGLRSSVRGSILSHRVGARRRISGCSPTRRTIRPRTTSSHWRCSPNASRFSGPVRGRRPATCWTGWAARRGR